MTPGGLFRAPVRRVFVLASGCLLAACGDDPAPPIIPPLAELELIAPGSGGCVRRGRDAQQSITAQIRVQNFTLRPPLACTEHECGTVRFTLRHSRREWVVESAQRFTSIATVGLPDGQYKIEAALLDTFGEAYQSTEEKEPKCKHCTGSFQLDATCGELDPEPEPAAPMLDAGGGSDAGTPSDAGIVTGANPDSGLTDAGIAALDASSPDRGPDGSVSPPNDPDASPAPLDAGAIPDASPAPLDAGAMAEAIM
jgi:hypothetical protein